MIEFFSKENPKVRRLDTLEVGDYFSMYSIGHSNFEIFIITDYVENSMVSVVSLKTGDSLSFSKDAKGYPLDLQVYYNYQYQ